MKLYIDQKKAFFLVLVFVSAIGSFASFNWLLQSYMEPPNKKQTETLKEIAKVLEGNCNCK